MNSYEIRLSAEQAFTLPNRNPGRDFLVELVGVRATVLAEKARSADLVVLGSMSAPVQVSLTEEGVWRLEPAEVDIDISGAAPAPDVKLYVRPGLHLTTLGCPEVVISGEIDSISAEMVSGLLDVERVRFKAELQAAGGMLTLRSLGGAGQLGDLIRGCGTLHADLSAGAKLAVASTGLALVDLRLRGADGRGQPSQVELTSPLVERMWLDGGSGLLTVNAVAVRPSLAARTTGLRVDGRTFSPAAPPPPKPGTPPRPAPGTGRQPDAPNKPGDGLSRG